MRPNIAGPERKMRWAKEHLDRLTAEVAEFRKTKQHNITTEDDVENGWYLIRLQFLPNEVLTGKIAMIAADFIYSLRASLDHLAWQLALLGGKIPSKRICFPIHDVNTVDVQVEIAKETFGIPETAIAFMRAFQPYNSGDAYGTHHLCRLHSLWNIEKHRHIAPHGTISDWLFRLTTDKIPPDLSRQLEADSVLDDGCVLRIPLALKDKVEFNPNPAVDIFFGDRAEKTDFKLADFVEMYEFIANAVFPAFAGFFPQ